MLSGQDKTSKTFGFSIHVLFNLYCGSLSFNFVFLLLFKPLKRSNKKYIYKKLCKTPLQEPISFSYL